MWVMRVIMLNKKAKSRCNPSRTALTIRDFDVRKLNATL
jgi:hypothetical protein